MHGCSPSFQRVFGLFGSENRVYESTAGALTFGLGANAFCVLSAFGAPKPAKAGPPGLEIQQSVVQVNPSHRLFLSKSSMLRLALTQPEFFA